MSIYSASFPVSLVQHFIHPDFFFSLYLAKFLDENIRASVCPSFSEALRSTGQ